MENNSILLSLCIPTNGKVEWIVPVIESIYAQKADCSLFEVVITDNGGKPELEDAVKKYRYENFHYYKTEAQGFTNQIDAFEKCNGLFCKMLNHRSKMLPGSIQSLLEFVRKYQATKPILYCAEGYAHGGEYIECANTDEFVRNLGLSVSWSAGTGAWREDIKDVRKKFVDNYFPHTVFLFGLRDESRYVIWNGKYEVMADDAGKGGYDLFYVFGVRLLDVVNRLRLTGRVSDLTFVHLKSELYRFICDLYLNEVLKPTTHTYIIKDIRQSMRVYYGGSYYYLMVIWGLLRLPIFYVRSIINRLKIVVDKK